MSFIGDHPYTAFIAMGAIVLVITGAEALYADMGHFGRLPIRIAWFAVVFPALILNYLGQAALILERPRGGRQPVLPAGPGWARLPLVVLATCATVIASQAVISGAFSMSWQAVRLGYLPQLTVRHTSSRESGQIYVPVVNWLLFAGVLVLMRSSGRRSGWPPPTASRSPAPCCIDHERCSSRTPRRRGTGRAWKLALVAVVLGGLELTYLGANLVKIVSGGWLPLLIAAVIVTLMTTWQRGRRRSSPRVASTGRGRCPSSSTSCTICSSPASRASRSSHTPRS